MKAVLVLAIDTSTPTVVAGVVRDGDTLAERILPDCREHNERLTPSAQEALTDAGVTFQDLDAIVVGEGPGPFTGLRVGMATAAAFGDALGIPVYGVSSLDAIALLIDAPTKLIATDARRKEIYWAFYEDGKRTRGPEVGSPEGFDAELLQGAVNVPGHIAEKLGKQTHDLHPTPASLVRAADFSKQPEKLTAQYLRRPDAKEPKAKPKSPAIPDVAIPDVKLSDVEL